MNPNALCKCGHLGREHHGECRHIGVSVDMALGTMLGGSFCGCDAFEPLPPAGPDDWEPCPRCYNMDGGCPFCGHGMVPKVGFNWP
jgi:hypothetical protein